MLAVNAGMDILGADAEALSQFRLQTAGIQNGTGADDLALGQAGNLGKHIGQNINRIGNDDVVRIGSMGHNIGRHLLQDINVGLCQIQAGHAGLSGHTTGDDDDIRAICILISAGTHDGRRMERSALVNIHSLALCLLCVHVHQQDLGSNALDHQVIGNGSADTAGTDDGNFAHRNVSPIIIYVYKFTGNTWKNCRWSGNHPILPIIVA